MIVHLHIEKAAGTTMLGYLMRQYKTHHLKSWWISDWVIPLDTECLFSHCPYGEPDKHFPGDHQYTTFLRDPVDRIVSLYYFVLNRVGNPEHDHYMNRDPIDLITKGDVSTFDNGMTRIIAGRKDIGRLPAESPVTERDLDKAKKNLETFAMVGFVESFDDDLKRFADKFGWNDTDYTRYNTGDRPPLAFVRQNIKDAIAEVNVFDLELVEFAKTMRKEN